MTRLKKNIYFSRQDFVRHISTLTLGRWTYNGSSISFLEAAEYLGVTPDSLRMRRRDSKVMAMLEAENIKVKKVKGVNHFYVDDNDFYLAIDEKVTEAVDDTLII